MSHIVVGSTVPAFAMETPYWGKWVQNADQIVKEAATEGHTVEFFAALQYDGRGRGHFDPLVELLDELRFFSIDSTEAGWTTDGRLQSICTGRNLIIDYALWNKTDWIYFADSDILAPDDILPRLLEVGHPVVGAHVPTYCLDGARILHRGLPGADIRVHWNTAGSLLVAKEVFRRVPWRHDPEWNQTDDPCTQREMRRLGYPTLVRHDVICRHHPPHVQPLENRGLNLSEYR